MIQVADRDSWIDDDELHAWRDVGRRLWPFVKFFGLCGGDPDAIRAVADLAKCLDLDSDSGIENAAHAVDQAKQRIAKQCAQWLIDHRFNGRKVRRSDMEKLVDEMKEEFSHAG